MSNKLKEKVHDKKDVLEESLIIATARDMTREDLEQFADRMRIDRNSFLVQLGTLKDKIENLELKLSQKEQDYYFNMRNLQMELVVLQNQLEKK